MSYKTTIVCTECGKEQEVPQLNAQPKEWITVGWVKTKLDDKMQSMGNEMIIDHFHNWEDCYKFVRRFVRKTEEQETE